MNTFNPSSGRKSLREHAYDVLKAAILDGTFAPGSQLTEPQLASQFQSSRSPIRDALGRLEQQGFVMRKSNGRIIVAPLDMEELEQLYIVRATVEGLATRLAAWHLTSTELEEMAEEIRMMSEASQRGDIERSLLHGSRFHSAILDACKNRPLIEIILDIRSRIERFRTYIASMRQPNTRVDEHRKILNALFDRNPELAEHEMIQHIRLSSASIIESVNSAGTGDGNSG